MLRALGLRVVFVAVVVLTPFTGAAEYAGWTEGLSDADFETDLLVALSLSSVVESAPVCDRCRVDIVIGVFTVGNDTAVHLAEPSPRTVRAPPTV